MVVLIIIYTSAWGMLCRLVAEENVFSLVIGVHIVSWVMQFIGHGIFESIEFLK